MSRGDRSQYRTLVGVVVLAVVTVLVGALAPATAGALERPGDAVVPLAGSIESPDLAAEEPETDNTVTYVTVREDGTARWQVTVRTRLPTEESVSRYEAFQERFRANRSTYRSQFRDPMVRVVAAASDSTGRSMVASNFTASTSVQTVPRRWGTVTYAFSWEKFAARDGDDLAVGDAFESDFYIAENDTLRLQAPEEYEFTSLRPPADDRAGGTATWVGRVDFGPGEPAARMRPATAGSGNGAGSADGGDSAGEGDANAGDGGGTTANGDPLGLELVLALVASVAAITGAAVWYRRRDGEPRPDGTDRATDAGPSPDATDGHDSPEPLTDGERVRRIVRDHGGRMRQADIVDQVDWSKSKVSRVLGDLAEDGVVQKTRIGRENVISLVDSGSEEQSSGDD